MFVIQPTWCVYYSLMESQCLSWSHIVCLITPHNMHQVLWAYKAECKEQSLFSLFQSTLSLLSLERTWTLSFALTLWTGQILSVLFQSTLFRLERTWALSLSFSGLPLWSLFWPTIAASKVFTEEHCNCQWLSPALILKRKDICWAFQKKELTKVVTFCDW